MVTVESGARAVLAAARARGWRLGTVESCTGGLIAGALTEIPGSSDVVEAGFVTYSNEAKIALVGVPEELLARVGAVSAETAAAMAAGALRRLPRLDLVLAVTGIAGPGGGSAEKPVGLVYFGLAQRDAAVITDRKIFTGDRTAIRHAAVLHGLAMLCAAAA